MYDFYRLLAEVHDITRNWGSKPSASNPDGWKDNVPREGNRPDFRFLAIQALHTSLDDQSLESLVAPEPIALLFIASSATVRVLDVVTAGIMSQDEPQTLLQDDIDHEVGVARSPIRVVQWAEVHGAGRWR